MRVSYANFLAAGPVYSFSLPEQFSSPPSTSTVVDFGSGGREIVFRPSATDEGFANPEYVLQTETSDSVGHTVEIFQHNVQPRSWVMRWQLEQGALYTHVRDLEGFDTVAFVVKELGIVTNSVTSLPQLVLGSGLTLAVSMIPGYQERVTYSVSNLGSSNSDGGIVAVILARPSTLGPGIVQIGEAAGGASVMMGIGFGIHSTVVAVGASPTQTPSLSLLTSLAKTAASDLQATLSAA